MAIYPVYSQSSKDVENKVKRIHLQRSKSCVRVKEQEEEIRRNDPVVEIKHGDCKGTMKYLIKFVYRRNALKKAYHWMEENCKAFANRVFNEFVVKGSVVR